jgi:CDP-diacylglycerol--glycerol-3-phosphate 3-phosphatidyltransferase
LTLLRVIITFITIFLIFGGVRIEIIVGLFIFGMITDMLDGQIARRFNMKTEFGRKFDPLADRFLMVGIVVALVINMAMTGVLTRPHILAIMLMMTREIITFPVALVALGSGKAIPQVKTIGKVTTVMQAITFPAVILNIYYPSIFWFSIYLALVTSACGIISGFTYIFDTMHIHNERTGRRKN